MAGIQSLMQAPGQAQQAPLPGMMPSQQGSRPGVPALVPSLSGMDIGKLLQMFNDPNSPVPKNRVLAAMDQQQKQMAAQKAVQGQVAMAQAQQQPGTVKDQVVQSALQELRGAQPTHMAAHGGMMHGYAGGGAVAFTNGGPVQKFQYGAGPRGIMAQPPMLTSIDGLPIYAPGPDKAPGETEAEYQARRLREAAEADEVANRPLRRLYRYFAEKVREPSAVAQMRAPAAQQAAQAAQAAQETPAARPDIPRFTSQELERYVKTAAPAPAPAPSALSGGQRQPAEAPAPAPAPITGLPALSPERARERTQELTQAEKLATDQAAVVERLSRASPEVLAARENLQRIMGSAYDPQKRTLEEAKDLYARGIGSSGEALGRMAAAMGGAKRLGQGLAAAAGAGSQFVGEQRKRVEDLQDKYNSLKSQLDITMAQAQYADVIGDDKLKRDALTKAEEIKKNLFDTQRGIRKEYFGEQVQQAQGIAALRAAASRETQARAAMIQAGKPSEIQQREALYRRDPSAYEAMFGAKESAAVANLVRAVNSDPRLKKLAESILPDAEAQYNARYKELVATYAPELLLGAGRGGASSGALEAATAIARGGK